MACDERKRKNQRLTPSIEVINVLDDRPNQHASAEPTDLSLGIFQTAKPEMKRWLQISASFVGGKDIFVRDLHLRHCPT